eukprot:TRINITY_DN11185_c0_g1_i1.p1 TRINITY_DN11185_c0_g1~~TRINITY_DN11185_c0_g1_i1.p1  ORF type:complete len:410 (-),score=102.19 TRINITY_DN11185_c0_g1_i1:67-1170(-)
MDGETLLMRALIAGHYDLSRVLLELGARCGCKKGGTTELHVAVKSHFFPLLPALLQAGSDVNALDFLDRTPLNLAVTTLSLECCRTLLAADADPNIPDMELQTPLLQVVASGINTQLKFELCELLLQYSANPNAANRSGQTPMWFVAVSNEYALAQLLLQHRANVNLASYDGRTPLFVAASAGNVQVVQVLLGAGVDPRLMGQQNIIQIAQACGHDDILYLLQLYADWWFARLKLVTVDQWTQSDIERWLGAALTPLVQSLHLTGPILGTISQDDVISAATEPSDADALWTAITQWRAQRTAQQQKISLLQESLRVALKVQPKVERRALVDTQYVAVTSGTRWGSSSAPASNEDAGVMNELVLGTMF